MTRIGGNRVRTLVLATIVAVGLAAGAFAYWTGAGEGAGTTVLGSPVQLTLSPGTAQSQLTPGGASSVAAVATNTNPYFVEIGSLALDTTAGTGGFDVDGAHTGCDVSALHFTTQDNGGAGWRVPPKVASTDGTLAIELDHALGMDADAADACQGAAFTVHLIAGAG